MTEIEKLNAGHPDTQSADIVAGNVEALRALFPEAFTEGKIDFEVLKQCLGGAVDERDEKYGLNWHGKRRARQIALTPSTGTLLPCPEDSVDWDTTQNLMIEGDNLEVLKLLQKSYAGKVKLIFIDPPYNTGGDFVYPDDFREPIRSYLEMTDQTSDGRRVASNSDASGRFHTNWLNMIYPRLKVAQTLLRNDGSIFVSIDDNEVHNLKQVMNEIFGEENFVAQVEWQKRYTRSNNTDDFTSVIDHILIYQKSDQFKVNLLKRDEAADARFTNPDNDVRGPWKATPFLNQVAPERRPNLCYPIRNPRTGKVTNPSRKAWRYERSVFESLLADNRLYWGKDGTRDVPDIKTFLSEVRSGMTPINFWPHQYASNTDQANREIKECFGEKIFDTPKPVLLIQRVLEHATDGNEIVVDFFAGSGTTGHAVMQQNVQEKRSLRFILVQLPEPLDPQDTSQKAAADFCDGLRKPRNVAELTKERLRRVGAKLAAEHKDSQVDFGFRAYKLSTSNVKPWEPTPADLFDTLLAHAEHLVPGRTESDILTELLLKLGLDLCVPIETKDISGKSVHSVGAGALFVCLSDGITRETVEGLAQGIIAWWQALAPAGDTRVVFKDSAFADDVAKTNMAAILNQAGIKDMRSL